MERIQVLIAANHKRAKLRLQGVEFDIPISNWNANGGLGLTLPWESVDLRYDHSFVEAPTSVYVEPELKPGRATFITGESYGNTDLRDGVILTSGNSGSLYQGYDSGLEAGFDERPAD